MEFRRCANSKGAKHKSARKGRQNLSTLTRKPRQIWNLIAEIM
jgi:hypothetical protein